MTTLSLAEIKQDENGFADVPREAMQFDFGAFQFAKTPNASGNIPITMTARSGNVINHWWWGRVVHDLDGMNVSKGKIIIDWCHDYDIQMGFLDKFQKVDGENGVPNLDCSGELVPLDDPGDITTKIIERAQRGIPYEASIDWSRGALRIEYLESDMEAEVNGYTVEGPCTIFREWPLMAVAICPHGADGDTESQFTRDGDRDPVRVQFTNSGVNTMTTKDSENKATPDETDATETDAPEADAPEADATETDAPEADAPEADSASAPDARSEFKRFSKAFGSPAGAKFFEEGLTFEAAQEKHLAAETARGDAAEKKLRSLDTGLTEELTSGGESTGKSKAGFKSAVVFK